MKLGNGLGNSAVRHEASKASSCRCLCFFLSCGLKGWIYTALCISVNWFFGKSNMKWGASCCADCVFTTKFLQSLFAVHVNNEQLFTYYSLQGGTLCFILGGLPIRVCFTIYIIYYSSSIYSYHVISIFCLEWMMKIL